MNENCFFFFRFSIRSPKLWSSLHILILYYYHHWTNAVCCSEIKIDAKRVSITHIIASLFCYIVEICPRIWNVKQWSHYVNEFSFWNEFSKFCGLHLKEYNPKWWDKIHHFSSNSINICTKSHVYSTTVYGITPFPFCIYSILFISIQKERRKKKHVFAHWLWDVGCVLWVVS